VMCVVMYRAWCLNKNKRVYCLSSFLLRNAVLNFNISVSQEDRSLDDKHHCTTRKHPEAWYRLICSEFRADSGTKPREVTPQTNTAKLFALYCPSTLLTTTALSRSRLSSIHIMLCQTVSHSQQSTAQHSAALLYHLVRPLCLSRAAGSGSLPLNALYTSLGCFPPPIASTVSLNRFPVALTASSLSRPTSSKAAKQSALITSACDGVKTT
jgi:hypothetical protein